MIFIFNLYVPDSYDGSEAYALYITLPGYQGLYFRGASENLKTEEFGFEAQSCNDRMIIVAPQLSDWEDDEYYGSGPFTEAYRRIYELYEQQGLSEQEIGSLLVLDVKSSEYFTSQGTANQHGGGAMLFAGNKNIMGWLFGH